VNGERLDVRFDETGSHGTVDLFVDTSFVSKRTSSVLRHIRMGSKQEWCLTCTTRYARSKRSVCSTI
jgi:hypothetical protein